METESTPTVPTKVCTKCRIEYPATREWFNVSKSGKYGLGSICKKCICLISAKWYARNHEKIKASKKKDRAENPEKVRALARKYYDENHEKIRLLYKKWCNENSEKVIFNSCKQRIKKQIGAPPPPELVEIKVLINKTKQLCKTLKN